MDNMQTDDHRHITKGPATAESQPPEPNKEDGFDAAWQKFVDFGPSFNAPEWESLSSILMLVLHRTDMLIWAVLVALYALYSYLAQECARYHIETLLTMYLILQHQWQFVSRI
jgi:hypothetical protein